MGLFAFNRMRRAQQEAGKQPAAPAPAPQNDQQKPAKPTKSKE